MSKTLQGSYGRTLRRLGAFFVRDDQVYETMRRLAERLDREGIAYAVVGGMAVAEHGVSRVTEDVDVLMTSDGLARFRDKAQALGYSPVFEGARKSFIDRETHVRVEVLTSGEYPGDGGPKPVAFPDPAEVAVVIEGVRIARLETLIELKLASGISASHRLRDLAHVQDLIQRLRLPLDFADRLDESVREAYRERWHAAARAQADEER